MYTIDLKNTFLNAYKRIVKKDQLMRKRVEKVLNLISNNPFYSSLKSHKVETTLHGECFSSWVTGDIRIIWNFSKEEKLTILALDLGSHSGKNKVYK